MESFLNLSDEDVQTASDEQLGRYLLTLFVGVYLERRGIPPDRIPSDWLEQLIRQFSKQDSASIVAAPIESALRKAAAGEWVNAGRMYRDFHFRKRRERDLEKAASRDAPRQQGSKRGGQSTGKQRKATATDRYAKWAQEAYRLIASGERDKRNVASLLAQRHKVSVSTIRRGLARHRNKTRTG